MASLLHYKRLPDEKGRIMRIKQNIILAIIALAFVTSIPLNAENEEQIITLAETAILPPKAMPVLNSEIAPLRTGKNMIGEARLNLVVFNPEIRLKTRKIESTLFTSSLITFTALNVADYFSTREALKYPGLEEGNPLMKPFVKNPYAFAAVKLSISTLSYYSMKSLFKKNKRMAWVMSLASNLALSYIVANNFRMIHKAQGR
jgi:hypothetical protein